MCFGVLCAIDVWLKFVHFLSCIFNFHIIPNKLKALVKKEENDPINDPETKVDGAAYEVWDCLVDRGFIGLQDSTRVIIPNRHDHILNVPEVIENKEIGSNRVNVEHYYQRLKERFAVMMHKFKYEKSFYEKFWQACAGLPTFTFFAIRSRD